MLSSPVDLRPETGPATTPWNFWLDAKITRSFSIGRMPFEVYIYVQNALNRKNVRHEYVHTGSTAFDGSHTPFLTAMLRQNAGEEFLQLYDLINHGHRQHYAIARGGDLFWRPREIRFGVQVGFDLAQ
ncbi:MAG: hypothetical protein ACE5I1_10440 [bacterium]